MGVCYVAVDVPIPSSKGSSTHVTEVAQNLFKLGAKVVILSRRTGPSQARSESFGGIPLYRVYRGVLVPIGGLRDEKSVRSGGLTLTERIYRLYLSSILAVYSGLVAAKLIRKYKLNVIIERETSYGAGAIASMLTGRPLVLEVNGPNFSPLSSGRAEVITAYSQTMVNPKSKSKTIVVDAGVNAELFRPDSKSRSDTRHEYNLDDSPVVGYVGTFQAWHGIDVLVRASRSILKEYPNTKFLMVGPNNGKAKTLATELGIADSFVFTGPVPYGMVPSFINAMDVVVSPTDPSKSEWTRVHGPPEQFKIFEYMACRKPVVATSVGPMQRVVIDGVTGSMVPPGDEAALARSVRNLIMDRDLAEKLASKGYETVTERYSWASHAREIYQAASSTLEGSRGKE